MCALFSFFFFFNDTATTEIYTLSLHDALPICLTRSGATSSGSRFNIVSIRLASFSSSSFGPVDRDRKSTRLNSSHLVISYAVFCLKKKKNIANVYLRVGYAYDVPAHRITSTSV